MAIANMAQGKSFTLGKSLPKISLLDTSCRLRHGNALIVTAQKQFKQAQKQTKRQTKAAEKTVRQLGPVDRFFDAQAELQQSGVSISDLLQKCLIVGLTFGTCFQVTHNNGLLPVYDVLPFKVGPFLESGLVPLVLAPIWLSYGYLAPVIDQAIADDPDVQEANERASSLSTVALTWVLAATQFIISDIMYLQGLEHWKIYPVMALCTAAIWQLTDRTKTSLGLGALLFVGAPLAEAVIVALGLWHYDRPDNFLGVCYWTGFCYATYAFGIANFARWQVQQQKQG